MARGMKVAAVFVAALVATLAEPAPAAVKVDGGASMLSFDQHAPDVTEVAARTGPTPVPSSPDTAPLSTAKLAAVPTAAPGVSRSPTDQSGTGAKTATVSKDKVVNEEATTPVASGNLPTNSKMADRINGSGAAPETLASPLHLDSDTAEKIKRLYDVAKADPHSREAKIVNDVESMYGKAIPHDVLVEAMRQSELDAESQKKVRLIKVAKAEELKADKNALGEEAREAGAVAVQEQAAKEEAAQLAALQANATANKKAGEAAVARANEIASKDAMRVELAANLTNVQADRIDAAAHADALMATAEKAVAKAKSNASTAVTAQETHVADLQTLLRAKQSQLSMATEEAMQKKLAAQVHNLQVSIAQASDHLVAVKANASANRAKKIQAANVLMAEALEAQEKVDVKDNQQAQIADRLASLEPTVVVAAMQDKAAKEKALAVAEKNVVEANAKLDVAKDELAQALEEQHQKGNESQLPLAEEVSKRDAENAETDRLTTELDAIHAQVHDADQTIQTKKSLLSHKETPAAEKDALVKSIAKLQVQVAELREQERNASRDAKTAAMACTVRHDAAAAEADANLTLKAFHVAMKMACKKFEEAFSHAHQAKVALADAKAATVGLEAKVEEAKITSINEEKAELAELAKKKEEADEQSLHDENATALAEITLKDTQRALKEVMKESKSAKVQQSVKTDEIAECDGQVEEQKKKCSNHRRAASLAKTLNNTEALKEELFGLEECNHQQDALMKRCSNLRAAKDTADKEVQKLNEAKEQLRIARMFMKDYKPQNLSVIQNMSAVLAARRDKAAQIAANASRAAEVYQDQMAKALATPGMGLNATLMRERFEALVRFANKAKASVQQSQARVDKSEKKKHAHEIFSVPDTSQKKLSDVLASLRIDGAFNCTKVVEGTGAIVAHISPEGANQAGMKWRAVALDADKAGLKSPWHDSSEEVCNMPPALYRIEFKQIARPVWKLPRLSADIEIPVEADGFSVVSREFFQSEMEISIAANPEQTGSFVEL